MQVRAVKNLAQTLMKLKDFKCMDCPEKLAEGFAEKVVEKMFSDTEDKEERKDKLLSILLNIHNLEGELCSTGEKGLRPEEVAGMDAAEMCSQKQKREAAASLRKRLREQEAYDKTSLQCLKCGLIRSDRLNVNQMGLDSEENGTQFDYHFGNFCECIDRSSSESESRSDFSDAEPPKIAKHENQ